MLVFWNPFWEKSLIEARAIIFRFSSLFTILAINLPIYKIDLTINDR
jgi:hypothetical protein